jgi:antitoxin component YwqK of YwqJK toxin-antitoxin module
MKPSARKLIFYYGDPVPKFEYDPIKLKEDIEEEAIVLKRKIGKKWIYEGEKIMYHENGQMASKSNWKNNKMHGRHEIIYYGNRLYKILHHREGKQFGQQKQYKIYR